MDMNEALNFAEQINDNEKAWTDSRLEAFEELRKQQPNLSERAYQIFGEKMEAKAKRSEAARKRVQKARFKRDDQQQVFQEEHHNNSEGVHHQQ